MEQNHHDGVGGEEEDAAEEEEGSGQESKRGLKRSIALIDVKTEPGMRSDCSRG